MTPIPDSNDVETIEQAPIDAPAPAAARRRQEPCSRTFQPAPGAKVLGALDNAAAQPDDGGFQGKVLVPPSQQEPGDDYVQHGSRAQPQAAGDDTIETVSLQPDAATQPRRPNPSTSAPTKACCAASSAMPRRASPIFLQKYPDHSLAGSAQYWLGETYYAQSDFKRAAANLPAGLQEISQRAAARPTAC